MDHLGVVKESCLSAPWCKTADTAHTAHDTWVGLCECSGSKKKDPPSVGLFVTSPFVSFGVQCSVSTGEPASQEATSEWLPGEGQDVNPPRIVEFEAFWGGVKIHKKTGGVRLGVKKMYLCCCCRPCHILVNSYIRPANWLASVFCGRLIFVPCSLSLRLSSLPIFVSQFLAISSKVLSISAAFPTHIFYFHLFVLLACLFTFLLWCPLALLISCSLALLVLWFEISFVPLSVSSCLPSFDLAFCHALDHSISLARILALRNAHNFAVSLILALPGISFVVAVSPFSFASAFPSSFSLFSVFSRFSVLSLLFFLLFM